MPPNRARLADGGDDYRINAPDHKRAKRRHKRLEPALPREVLRHKLRKGERTPLRDGAARRVTGVKVGEQLDIVSQRVSVIRHEGVE